MPLGIVPLIVLTEGGVDFQDLYAVGYDGVGAPDPFVAPVTWETTDPNVCNPGNFSGAFGEACHIVGGIAGTCTLTARCGNVSATATIEVDAVPPPPPPPPPELNQMSIEVGVLPMLAKKPAVKRFFGIPKKR